jgi:hypothetical protein
VLLQVGGGLTLSDGADADGVALSVGGTGSVSVSATGDVHLAANVLSSLGTVMLQSTQAISMGTLARVSGSQVTLRAHGMLTLNQVQASGQVVLASEVSQIVGNPGATHVVASSLDVSAGTQVGSASQALVTQIEQLTARAAEGVYLTDTANLSVKTVSAPTVSLSTEGQLLNGLARGSINISAHALTLSSQWGGASADEMLTVSIPSGQLSLRGVQSTHTFASMSVSGDRTVILSVAPGNASARVLQVANQGQLLSQRSQNQGGPVWDMVDRPATTSTPLEVQTISADAYARMTQSAQTQVENRIAAIQAWRVAEQERLARTALLSASTIQPVQTENVDEKVKRILLSLPTGEDLTMAYLLGRIGVQPMSNGNPANPYVFDLWVDQISL